MRALDGESGAHRAGAGAIRALFGFLLAAFAAAGAFAQSGGLRVVVTDPGGNKPVAGVKITLTSTEQQVAKAVRSTDAQGSVYFPVLAAGSSYVVDVDAPGFARQEITKVRVRIGDVTVLPVRLAVAVSEKVVITSHRDVIDLEHSETSTRFGGDFIQDLPVMGRFYQDVLTLAAGVQDANGDGNPNVLGARASEFRAEVGGISNQDPLTGGWMSQVNPDSIEEIEVVRTGAGVEFSRAVGGFAKIIQKQGSNELEGTVGLLLRSSLADPDNATGSTGAPRPDYTWWQPSILLTGPIVKDRVWYRLSHEWIHQEEPISAYGMSAIATRDQTVVADQITWQASPRNKLAFQFSYDPMTRDNLGVNALTPESASVRKETGGPTYTLTWTSPVSPSILVDTVASWQNYHQRILPTEDGVANDCLSGARDLTGAFLFPTLTYGQCLDERTGRTSGSYPIRQSDQRQRLTVRSQATFFVNRFLGSSHQFKLGLVVENERYFRSLDQAPQILYNVRKSQINSPGGGALPVEMGRWDATIAVPETADSKVLGTVLGLYAEDTLKPRENLSVTVGLRLDREEVHSVGFEPLDPAAEAAEFAARLPGGFVWEWERMLLARDVFTAYESISDFSRLIAQELDVPTDRVVGIMSPVSNMSQEWIHKRRAADVVLTNVNPAPRLSLSWDPWSDGKTKVAATAGRVYGAILLGIPAVEIGPATTTVTLRGQRLPSFDTWGDIDLAGGINPAVSVKTVDRGLRTPHMDETTLTFEREVLPETSLLLQWVRRRYRDQLQTQDVNHYSYDYGTCVPGGIDWSRPDGKLDDCEGLVTTSPVFGEIAVHAPDGYPDTYTYNPGWGAVYMVGNFNSADYDAWILELTRRQYRNWQMVASYTYSRAVGDAEEWLSPLGDDRSQLDAERGYLSYDQRHVVKVNATTITPWGFRFGMAANWASGLPYSILLSETTYDSLSPQYPVMVTTERERTRYPTGKRNSERNRPMLSLNVKFDREWMFSKGRSLQASVEVFNLLGDRYYTIYNKDIEMGRQVNGTNEAYLTNGRQLQFGVKLSF